MKYLLLTLLLFTNLCWGEEKQEIYNLNNSLHGCIHVSVQQAIPKYRCLGCGRWISVIDLMVEHLEEYHNINKYSIGLIDKRDEYIQKVIKGEIVQDELKEKSDVKTP